MSGYEEQEYTKQLDISIWRKLFIFLKNYKKNIYVLLITNAIIALVDVTYPVLTKYAIDVFIVKDDYTTLTGFIFVYVLMFIAKSFSIYNFVIYAGKLELGVVYDVRKQGFLRLQNLSFSYFDNTPVGWIMARLTTDIQRMSEVIAWGLLDITWGFLVIGLVIVYMFFLNVKLAVITLCVMPVLIILSMYFQKRILKAQREVRKSNSKITGAFNEGISGARTTKTLVREEENYKEFQKLSQQMKVSSIHAAVLSAVYLPVVLSIGSIALALVIYSGGNEVILGTIGFGTLSVFISYAIQIFEPIQQIARILSDMQSAQAAAERTIALLEIEPEIVDTDEIIQKYGDVLNPKPENWQKIIGDIVFKNVDFTYNTGEKVLENFNLHIKAGEKVALVGETGAGKTTIVNLICRFYEPTSGKILIDGVDYKERSQIWLQSNLGYVLQSPHLFSGTIMENIRYGKLTASDGEVIEAAKLANAYDFIMKFPQKFQTLVGEGGGLLSSGEKQLISFARAIISDPRIFVLDEATSSVDTETEIIIQETINKVLENRTSFIIAHRLSTIRSCDKILVIKDGETVEVGNHKSLIDKKGYYYNLYMNQFIKDEEHKIINHNTASLPSALERA